MAKSKTKPTDDGNSETELIELLTKVLTGMFGGVHEALLKLQVAVALLEQKNNERHEALMTALEDLTQAVSDNVAGQAALTTAVNAAIVKIGSPSPTDAQLNTLRDAIKSSTDSDVALTAALNTAVGGTTPPVEPPVV